MLPSHKLAAMGKTDMIFLTIGQMQLQQTVAKMKRGDYSLACLILLRSIYKYNMMMLTVCNWQGVTKIASHPWGGKVMPMCPHTGVDE